MSRTCVIHTLGEIEYTKCLALQRQLVQHLRLVVQLMIKPVAIAFSMVHEFFDRCTVVFKHIPRLATLPWE